MSRMKYHFVTLGIGFGLGLAYFFGLAYARTDVLAVKYYAAGLPLFIIYALTPWLRNRMLSVQNKYSFLFFSFLFFSFGFILPAGTWAFIVIQAFKNSFLF